MNAFRIPVLIALMLGVFPVAIQAQPTDVIVSPDITVSLAGTLLADEDVAEDDLAGSVVLENLGAIPANADISAYHQAANGDHLFVLDITVELPGLGVITPREVVRYNGASYTIEFSGSTDDILPAGSRIDALTQIGSGNIVISMDTTVMLGGTTFADEDLVTVVRDSRGPPPNFAMFLDGSTSGLSGAVDIDAAHYVAGSDQLYVSLDTGGTAGRSIPTGIFSDGFEIRLTFADEDLILLESGNWSISYDGNSEHAEWLAADLNAAFVTP